MHHLLCLLGANSSSFLFLWIIIIEPIIYEPHFFALLKILKKIIILKMTKMTRKIMEINILYIHWFRIICSNFLVLFLIALKDYTMFTTKCSYINFMQTILDLNDTLFSIFILHKHDIYLHYVIHNYTLPPFLIHTILQ